MTALPEHWKSYFRALNPSTINGCGEGAWRSRRGSQVILEGNHDNPESGSHQRGLKFQNFFGQNALRPLPPPSHLKKGNNCPLLIKSVILFRPAGYFNFCWTPVKEGKRGKRGCESLKLPTALNYHAAYFYILAVYFKIRFTMLCLSGFELYSHWVPLTADCVCPFKKQS